MKRVENGYDMVRNKSRHFSRYALLISLFAAFRGISHVPCLQVQFAGRTPCPLASVTSWSCWVAALSGRSKNNVAPPVALSDAHCVQSCHPQTDRSKPKGHKAAASTSWTAQGKCGSIICMTFFFKPILYFYVKKNKIIKKHNKMKLFLYFRMRYSVTWYISLWVKGAFAIMVLMIHYSQDRSSIFI